MSNDLRDIADRGDQIRINGTIPMEGGPKVVTRIPVTVLVRITPLPNHRWLDERHETIAVLCAASAESNQADDLRPQEQDNTEQADGVRFVRHSGLTLELHPDEAESYFYNLLVEAPRCFVAMREDDEGGLEPFVVTAAADLANSYEEADHRVDSVPLDPALYPSIEGFVLTHYVPEKKIKRKRKNWSKP